MGSLIDLENKRQEVGRDEARATGQNEEMPPDAFTAGSRIWREGGPAQSPFSPISQAKVSVRNKKKCREENYF